MCGTETQNGTTEQVAVGRGARALGPALHFFTGDSSIGMNVAAKALQGNKLAFDPRWM